jgi:hypothetical protein
VDFVDNSLAKNRQRTGALAVDKSQKAATYPPRTPLPTNSTASTSFFITAVRLNEEANL